MADFFFKIRIFWERFNHNARNIKAWDDYFSQNYHTFKPPSRPSAGDQEIYQRYIDNLGGTGRVLILGATPYIRQLLAGFSGEIFVADYSNVMHEKTSGMLDASQVGKEKYLRLDWLNLGKFFDNDSVDLVLGDLVFTQFSPNLRRGFLETVNRVIKPGGRFVTRTKIFNPTWKDKSVIEIIREDLNYSSPVKSYGVYFSYRLGDKVLNLDTQSFDTLDCLRCLYSAHREVVDAREHYYLHYLIDQYQKFRQIRTHFLKDEAEKLLKKFFVIEDRFSAPDYPESDFFPIYSLKKSDK